MSTVPFQVPNIYAASNYTANSTFAFANSTDIIDQYGAITFPQTTAGITVTFNLTPANTSISYAVSLMNTGTTVSLIFSINSTNYTVAASSVLVIRWNGSAWSLGVNNNFTGATSTTAGTAGTVPIPAIGQQDNFLYGDGTFGGQIRLPYLFISNITASGSIGTAAATVDTYAMIEIQQATTGLTITFPNPTVTTRASRFILRNSGTASFITGNGVFISPGSAAEFEWDIALTSWRPINSTVTLGNRWSTALTNQTANGALTNAQTMEQYEVLLLPQTTTGITLTLPALSVAQVNTTKINRVINTGSVPVTVGGILIPAGAGCKFYPNGTTWTALGEYASPYIGATASAAGATGTVPAAAAGQQTEFLTGAGTYSSPIRAYTSGMYVAVNDLVYNNNSLYQYIGTAGTITTAPVAGANWNIIGPGISASMGVTGTQSVPNNTITGVTFTGTAGFNTGNAFTVSATGFTAPVAGVYRISYNLEFDINATGYRLGVILLNGTAQGNTFSMVAPSGNTLQTTVNGSTLLSLATGNTIAINCKQTSGGALTILYGEVTIELVSYT